MGTNTCQTAVIPQGSIRYLSRTSEYYFDSWSSIVSGAPYLGDTAYGPNPFNIDVGQTIKWTNDDTAFHTVTSGIVGSGDVGKVFDSRLTGPTAMTSKGKTFGHRFKVAGE